ncbi:hypothetical protein TRVA0_038S01310 [Trichomonascus vanleenenianus]|uniref:uncharacterized protein n=1 Tax=Trichomonascus vanleenenianus TaxID=2268995 RepID=UPI003ECB275D
MWSTWGAAATESILDLTDSCTSDEGKPMWSKECQQSVISNAFEMGFAILAFKGTAGQHGTKRSTIMDSDLSNRFLTHGEYIISSNATITIAEIQSNVHNNITTLTPLSKNELQKRTAEDVQSDLIPFLLTRTVGSSNVAIGGIVNGSSIELRHVDRSLMRKETSTAILSNKGGIKVFSNSFPVANWDDVSNWLNVRYNGNMDAYDYIEQGPAQHSFSLDIIGQHNDGQMIVRSETVNFGENWETGWDCVLEITQQIVKVMWGILTNNVFGKMNKLFFRLKLLVNHICSLPHILEFLLGNFRACYLDPTAVINQKIAKWYLP